MGFLKTKPVLISIHTRRALESYVEPILMYGRKNLTNSKQLEKKLEETCEKPEAFNFFLHLRS